MSAHTFDDTVERLGRWTAARTTRRSFLHRIGQFAMLIAVGPTIATILMKRAEARVCGQTGVTPKCSTFDCVGENAVWGWCWYASDGCCRNNGLKKICDCCIVNYPNVHGYCPSGTNVACIVESCGEDPRVMPVGLTAIEWNPANGYYSSAIAAGQGRASRAVVANADDYWMPLIAAPLAGVLGVPLLAVGSNGPTPTDLSALSGAGVQKVLVVGRTSNAVRDRLQGAGLTVEVISNSDSTREVSEVVADRIRSVNDINRTVTVADSGLSRAAGPLAANFAALAGFPLAVGTAAASSIGMPTVYVGPEPGDAGVVSERTSSTTLIDLSIELAELASATPFVESGRITIVPEGSSDLAGLINLQASIVLHPLNHLGPLAPWFENHGLRFGRWTQVFHTQGPGQLSPDEYWRLQGTINGFRVDELMGQPGEGLPVFRQPLAEREIGAARVDGAIPWGSQPAPNYWTSVAQTFRS